MKQWMDVTKIVIFCNNNKGDIEMNKENEVSRIVEKLVKVLWDEDTQGHGKAAIEELMKICEILSGQDDKS